MRKNKSFIPANCPKIVCLIGLMLFTGCAAPKVTATKMLSAKYVEAAKLKDVAVLPIDGANGKAFTSEIEGTLASIRTGEKAFFSLVERAKLNSIIAEMKLGESGLVDPNSAAKIGELVGAKGIYFGTITESDTQDSKYTEERQKCAYNVTKTGERKGKTYTYQECGRYENYNVKCTKRVSKFSFVPKLVEVKTSQIVYSNNIESEMSDAKCSDSGKPLKSAQELLRLAKANVLRQFKTDVAPHSIQVTVNLMKSDKGIKAEDAINKFNQGLDYAKNGRMERACELWEEASTLDAKAPSLLYNLAICSELNGDPEKALQLIKQSDVAIGEPNVDITAALNRLSRDLKNKSKLAEQL